MPKGVFNYVDDEYLPEIYAWAERNEGARLGDKKPEYAVLAQTYLAACHLIGAMEHDNPIEERFWPAAFVLRDRLGKKILREYLTPNAGIERR